MADKITEMFSRETIEARIQKLGAQISRDYEGRAIKLVCVLRGAVVFYAELAKYITCPVRFDFISVSSYGDSTNSSGKIKIRKPLDEPVEGEHVIVVEDIIDTGNTLQALSELLKQQGAASVALAALLDKPDRRQVPIKADYIGFEIPDKFVVGYGLDFAQYYRNLPYIGTIDISETENNGIFENI